MARQTKHFFEFGAFRLDLQAHRLIRDGASVPLPPKAMEALLVLLRHGGELMKREELMQAVWADTFVEDANLTVAISHLRKALGQNGETAEYIETIPRVGYRFVAEVREITEQPRPLLLEKHTLSRTVIEEEFLHDETQTDKEVEAIVVQPTAQKILPLAFRRKAAALALSFAALSAVAFGSYIYLKNSERKITIAGSGPLASIKSIAVLPPRPLSNATENASLSLGMADSIITRLGALHKVTVRPTTSVSRYVDNNQDPITAGRALGVDAVLEGSLQRDSGRTRVTLRLLDIAHGTQLWASNFDEPDADIFKLQDSISQRVAEALFLNLTQNEKALLAKQQTTNPEAYAQYLKGNYFWNKRGPESAKSLECFRRAIELDPNFAQAYAALAAVDASTSIRTPEAEALIDKALQLDNMSAEAHATKGFIKMFLHWDWEMAESELDRAIELNPNSSVAHHWKGVYLSIRGRLDEAKGEMRRALELDPLSLIIMTDLGELYYFAHEYDQAMEYCNRVLAFDPEFHDAHTYLVDIYRIKGMDREALNELIQAYLMPPEGAQAARDLFAREGLRGVFNQQLQSQLNQLNSENDQRSLVALMTGRSYCRLKNKEQALKWLAVAVEEPRAFWTPYIGVDPLYDPLRNDARFKQILNRIGLGS